MALEAVQAVLVVLKVIQVEWKQCLREQVEARKVSDVLAMVIPKIEEWAKSKQQLNSGEFQMIGNLRQDADEIKSWLSAYREEGVATGYIARGLKMAKNAAKKVVGMETSYAKLLDLVESLEQNLKNLQIDVVLDLHADVQKVLKQQEELMNKVQQTLNALPRGSEVPSATAEEIAGLVGMDIKDVVNELLVKNEKLWGQVHEKLEDIGAEVHETNLGVKELHRKFDLHLGGNVIVCDKVHNPEAAEFWKKYFGDLGKVSWNIFAGALESSFSFDKDDLDRIRGHFDMDGDGHIGSVEFNVRLSFQV
jgi:hypothetical protein